MNTHLSHLVSNCFSFSSVLERMSYQDPHAGEHFSVKRRLENGVKLEGTALLVGLNPPELGPVP